MFQVAQSPTYRCTKCDCMTSGIILQDKPRDRHGAYVGSRFYTAITATNTFQGPFKENPSSVTAAAIRYLISL